MSKAVRFFFDFSLERFEHTAPLSRNDAQNAPAEAGGRGKSKQVLFPCQPPFYAVPRLMAQHGGDRDQLPQGARVETTHRFGGRDEPEERRHRRRTKRQASNHQVGFHERKSAGKDSRALWHEPT